VEEAEQAYGKHVKKEGEEPVPDSLLKQFLRVQNGADIRGVVLEGGLSSCTPRLQAVATAPAKR
jgi:hypothetical protein